MTPTAIPSPAEARSAGVRSPWPARIGHHGPFALWTLYALAKPWLGDGAGLWCPTHHLLGFCPTCGMTGQYSALLYTGRISDAWTCCILGAFVALSAAAIARRRHA